MGDDCALHRTSSCCLNAGRIQLLFNVYRVGIESIDAWAKMRLTQSALQCQFIRKAIWSKFQTRH